MSGPRANESPESVKKCRTCGAQGHCKDSRQLNGYVRRRYHCGCGHTWTTAEFLIEEGGDRGYKVKHYLERRARELLDKVVERIRTDLS